MSAAPKIETDARRARAAPFVVAWLVMMLLGGASLWTAFLGLGKWGPIAEFCVAATQTAILFSLFMRLKGPPTLKWMFAASGFFWLLFLFGLSMTDYSNRRGWPALYNPAGQSFHAPLQGR